MVGDDDMFINLRDAVDVIEHTTEDGVFTYFQQGLWEVFGQLTQSRSVTCG